MAKKSSSAMGTWVGVIVAAIGVYLTWKWLSAPHATSGLTNGFVGGGFGGGAYGSSATSADANAQQNSLVQKLVNGLSKLLGGKSGGGLSLGTGGGNSALGPQSASALKSEIAAIGQYSTTANNMPLSSLGGASLATYEPNYDLSESIPYQSTGLFDLSGIGFSPSDLGGSDFVPALQNTDFIGGESIDYVPLQNFDLSGIGFDPGDDYATVPAGIGEGNLSDNFGGGIDLGGDGFFFG